MTHIGPGNTPNSKVAGIINTSQREAFFLLGMAFTQSSVFTMGSGGVLNFLIDPTNYLPDQEQIYNKIIYEIPAFSATAGPILIEFFSNPVTSSPGTDTFPLPFNRIADSQRTVQLKITQGPTVSDFGVKLSEILIPATSIGIHGTPAAVTEILPFSMHVGENGTPLLMRVTNQNGSNTMVGIRHNWFEI